MRAALRSAVIALLCLLKCASWLSSQQGLSAHDDLRLNQIQVIGSHNSYKEAISPKLLEYYRARRPEGAVSLDYWHPRLSAQLDQGLRKLELDVFHDPQGGRYAEPGGLDWAPEEGTLSKAMFDLSGSLDETGFKVLHIQDLDFRSNCPTWAACLLELRTWSEAHPRHLPALITVNAKDQLIARDGYVHPLAFDRDALQALDRETVRVLGRDRLLTPDDVRGDHETLRQAVLERGWPTLGEVRGRFLFVLDESGIKRDAYLEASPTLEGRVMFANVDPSHPAAAVRILNDPLRAAEEIRRSVRRGLLVRTRADANTREARANTTDRRDAAFASGAHFVSTDYYTSDQSVGTSYLVRLPDAVGAVARCNPISARDECKIEPVASRPNAPRLVAHRGGVVSAEIPENSRAAIEAAIERGYWMIEVDLQETRDGAIVVHHDDNFRRFYGHPGKVAEMTRAEIEELRMQANGEPPLFLDELVELARGRVRLMLDWKTRSPTASALPDLEAALRQADLLSTSDVIGTSQARAHFVGKARVGRRLEQIEQAADRGEDVAARYFLFEHGRDLTARDLLRARELGVAVVPSVNLFHYDDLERREAAARHDLERLRAMGVEQFQIDAVYDRWLMPPG